LSPAVPVDPGEATLELIRLFVVLLGAAALVTIVARRINLPYTVALVAVGMAASVAEPLKVEITPQLVLVVLLPALIFEASYQTDFGKLRPSLGGVALLAGPGVLITAALIAAALALGAGMPLPQAFVVGAMLSATDPAAVIATFKRLRTPRRLATFIEAESVFNDGTGIVVFAIAVDLVSHPAGPLDVGVAFVSVAIVSTAIGAVAGFVASRVLPNVGDHLIEISLSLVLAYGTYLAADAIHQSGVIATAVAGIVLGNYGRRLGLSERTEEALDTVWEFVAFLATAFVFLLIGFAISASALIGAAGPIAWAVVAALAARAIIVYGLLGAWRLAGRALGRREAAGRRLGRLSIGRLSIGRLSIGRLSIGRLSIGRLSIGLSKAAEPAPPRRRSGARNDGELPLGWLHVIFWSGLRGAVSTALALSLPADFPNRVQLQGITFGVVIFTLLVQATTAEVVVNRWGQKPKSNDRAPLGSRGSRSGTGAASSDATAGSAP
jgi:CPA1 family monovalent cation:H+ antiporter